MARRQQAPIGLDPIGDVAQRPAALAGSVPGLIRTRTGTSSQNS